MKHLHEKTKGIVINSSNEERIFSIKRFKWIGYTQASNILKSFDDLINYPIRGRMPNMLLIGDSNNGKTALLNKFVERNPSYVDDVNDELIVPALMIQAPPEPDEKRLYNAILEQLFAPYKSSEKNEMRQQRVVYLLKKVKTRLLIIDEIHHLLAGTISKQRAFRYLLKFLSNELKISMVCAGTRDALNAIQSDPQLANRFPPKFLRPWKNDPEFLRLLASFEKILPLKEPSQLIESSLASKILSKSEGLIGEISKILELSAILAIESGVERINKNILDNIDYIPPSDRKKMIHRM